ncbi:hypothetical protein HLB03_05710, partial [Acidianus sp. DSM 29099]|nr:hypothetical protein [Acidianus sp. RZ1]
MSSVPSFNLPQEKVSFDVKCKEYLKLWLELKKELDAKNVKALVYGSVGIFYRLSSVDDAVELMKLYRKNGPQDMNVIVMEKD